jgi:ABC-type dipeptide/oligopeptide/nickel transport system permease component
MGAFMLMAALVIVGNLAADLAYGVADPRIRLD